MKTYFIVTYSPIGKVETNKTKVRKYIY